MVSRKTWEEYKKNLKEVERSRRWQLTERKVNIIGLILIVIGLACAAYGARGMTIDEIFSELPLF